MASTLPLSNAGTAVEPPARPTPRPALARVLREGLLAGVCAYAAVVLVVAIYDISLGYPLFHTPSLIGGFFLFGARGAALGVDPAWVLAYNGTHLLVSLVSGVLAAFLVLESERLEGFWYVGFMAVLMGATWIIAMGGGLAVEVAQLVSWTTVVAATAAWFAGMLGYLAWAHGDDIQQFRHNLED
jgi:hypothetical protein